VDRALRVGNHAVTWRGQLEWQQWSWLHVVANVNSMNFGNGANVPRSA
jgi:hypothetical protein